MTNYMAFGSVLLFVAVIIIAETMGYDATAFVSRKFIDLLEVVTFWR